MVCHLPPGLLHTASSFCRAHADVTHRRPVLTSQSVLNPQHSMPYRLPFSENERPDMNSQHRDRYQRQVVYRPTGSRDIVT